MAAAATTPGTVSSVVTHPVEVTDPKDELVQLMAKLDRGEMGLVQVADSIEAALAKRKFVYSLDMLLAWSGWIRLTATAKAVTPSKC